MVHEAQGQMVQEVAAGGLPAPPSRYVLREKDRPTGGTAAPEVAFPTVDLKRLADPGDVEETGKLRSALESWGLFKVTGHGMPEALLDGIRDAGMEFFHLPAEEKLKTANRTEDGEFQPEGYGIDRVDTDEQVLDWCDRLYLTVQPEDARRTQFWPTRPPSLARLLHEYAVGSEQVARGVLRAMARALGFGEEFFLAHVGERGGADARFTYYPPTHRVVASGRERMSLVLFYQPEPHRDLEPAGELVGAHRPAMYRGLKAKAFADGFWDAFALGERTIDFLKIKMEQEREQEAAGVASSAPAPALA